MIEKTLVYFETIDGKKFYQTGPDGYDSKARSKAIKHEIEFLTKSLGEHKYYVIEKYSGRGYDKILTKIGYEPRIHKESGFTKHLKFAMKYKSINDAYKHLNEDGRIIGLDD